MSESEKRSIERRFKAWISRNAIPRWIFDCGVFLMVCFLIQAPAFAITEDQAARAIMGEARGEPYLGKIALAEALRNRNTLDGVYGYNARFSAKSSVWRDARDAWHDSSFTNLVKGANHWFSEADKEKLDKKQPRWYRRLVFVKQIHGHYFYREVKK